MASVAILLGSTSDEAIMESCRKYLTHFGISFEQHVLSAHRQPVECTEFVRSARSKGFKVIIAAAGMAAHLPGVAAAHTTLPVIGVPLPGSELAGVDALYSIVQMPPGIPVGTVAIGKPGATNAAILAAEILSLADESIVKKLEAFRAQGSKL